MAIADSVERARGWSRQFAREVAALPDTLSQLRNAVDDFRRVAERLDEAASQRTLDDLRHGAENFRKVTQRFIDATGAMEQYANLPSVGDVLERAQEANRSLREQIAGMPGAERMATAMEDLSESLVAMGRLMPFWARTPRKEPPPGKRS